MLKLLCYFFFIFFVLLVLELVNLLSSNFEEDGGVYPIESGFLSFLKEKTNFNLSFFIILLIFVLFDVEVIFVVFFPVVLVSFFNCLFIYLFILGTLIFEWFWGKLIWY